MSINKLISINVPILNAMDRIGLDNSKLRVLFNTWAEQAEKQIGSPNGYVRQHKVLDISNCQACLPKNAMILEGGIMGDHGCDCGDLFNRFWGGIISSSSFSESNQFLVVDSSSESGQLSCGPCIDYKIQNNKMVFDCSSYNGKQITIQFMGQKVDCDGFFEVSENHDMAIQEYILWMYYQRQRKKNSATFAEINMHMKEWNRMGKWARAEDQIPTPGETERITSMLHDPFAGIGLDILTKTYQF